jgi:hypothetical protein
MRDLIIWQRAPRLQDSAFEVGDADLVHCKPTLDTWGAEQPAGPGYCAKIAWASDNPGYDVDVRPAPPLKKVRRSRRRVLVRTPPPWHPSRGSRNLIALVHVQLVDRAAAALSLGAARSLKPVVTMHLVRSADRTLQQPARSAPNEAR